MYSYHFMVIWGCINFIEVLDVTMEFEECERRKCVSVNVADNLPDSSTTFFDLSLIRTARLNSRITLQPQAASPLS